MSRSGYCDSGDIDNWSLIKWRGMVTSATRGRRGQVLLKDLLVALDAMPIKRLITDEIEANGEVCALGALARARGLSTEHIDPECPEQVARIFDIAPCLAQEIVFENDEAGCHQETAEQRWGRVRAWVSSQIKSEVTNESRS